MGIITETEKNFIIGKLEELTFLEDRTPENVPNNLQDLAKLASEIDYLDNIFITVRSFLDYLSQEHQTKERDIHAEFDKVLHNTLTQLRPWYLSPVEGKMDLYALQLSLGKKVREYDTLVNWDGDDELKFLGYLHVHTGYEQKTSKIIELGEIMVGKRKALRISHEFKVHPTVEETRAEIPKLPYFWAL